MNDRLTTLWGALGALFVLALLFFPGQEQDTSSKPTSLESGPHGYLALHNWLEKSGIEVQSIRRRLQDFFPDSGIQKSGNVLVSTFPNSKPQRLPDQSSLRNWIREGNTLLLLAAINETPDWAMDADVDAIDEVFYLLSVDFDVVDLDEEAEKQADSGEESSDSRSWWKPFDLALQPYSEHPLMDGVVEMRGVSDFYSSIFQPNFQFSEEFPMRIGRFGEGNVDALWQLSYGEGRVILSSAASLFSNRMLGEADNAQFLMNVLNRHLAPGGVVLFDDFHQGVSDLYDPQAFFSDSRLYRSVLFLVALWLFYLVGNSARLGPLRVPVLRSQQASLVMATGVLMGRKLEPAEAGRAMVENWLSELRDSGRLSLRAGASPPWDALAQMPLVDGELLQSIRDHYARLGRGEKVDLKQLHNDIQTLKRNMA